jgi:hypothetical protein
MNRARQAVIAKLGFVLGFTLPGFTTYGQPSVSVGVSVGLPAVQIRAASDFYEPLTPYGRWEVVGAYGRCWIPGRVEADWRPYCEGYWQRTDDGWYWVSDEPWAWATYHYGRWDLSSQFGWYWVPQTQWAPAWVSWNSGGGYIGWAPLYPSGVRVISPRAYVFVEERHFTEPVRRSALVVNSTTIINKTVMGKAPATAVIEKASGRKVQAVAVQDLRHKEEAGVAARQRTPATVAGKTAATPGRNEPGPGEKNAVVSKAASHDSAAPAPKNREAQSENTKPVLAAVTPKPDARPSARPEANHPASLKEPTPQNANKQPATPKKSAQPPVQREPRVSEQPAMERPATSERSEPNTADKNHGGRGKE